MERESGSLIVTLKEHCLSLTQQAERAYNYEFLDPWLVKQFEDIKEALREIKNKINANDKL